jgi:biotin carboxylase
MRLVTDPDDLESAFRTASSEAEAAFADGSLYVERALVGALHVEIQVLGDGEVGALHLGERTLHPAPSAEAGQRRGPRLRSPELRAEMEDAARRATEALRYRGAGTFEFLLDEEGRFYFIEMNTRLQVEHPVTELVTGIDLAQAQLRIAAGEGLPATGRAELRGHAIELRINAEDPARLPARAGNGDSLPAAARPRRPGRHTSSTATRSRPSTTRSSARCSCGRRPPRCDPPGARALTEFELEGVPTTRSWRSTSWRASRSEREHDRLHRGDGPDASLAWREAV